MNKRALRFMLQLLSGRWAFCLRGKKLRPTPAFGCTPTVLPPGANIRAFAQTTQNSETVRNKHFQKPTKRKINQPRLNSLRICWFSVTWKNGLSIYCCLPIFLFGENYDSLHRVILVLTVIKIILYSGLQI